MTEVRGRDAGLDALKWAAIVFMVIDHLRYIDEALRWAVVPGRLALPFFCLAMAVNIARQSSSQIFTRTNKRYLGQLFLFAIISQPVYLLASGREALNIMAYLLLALMLLFGFRRGGWRGAALAVPTVMAALIFKDALDYRISGLLLPVLMYLGLTKQGRERVFWLTASSVAALDANAMFSGWGFVGGMPAYEEGKFYLSFCVIALAPFLGLKILEGFTAATVRQVGRWGYWFYPGHLLVIAAAHFCVKG